VLATFRRGRRRFGDLIASPLFALALILVLAPAVGATTVNHAFLLQPNGSSPLGASPSAAKFAFGVSADPKCPTDSRHPPYYWVWSYLVPAGTDIRTVMFRGQLIDLSKGFQLVTHDTRYGPIAVEADTDRVPDPGNGFSLSYWKAENLLQPGAPSARWQMGLACVPAADGAGVHLGEAQVVWPVDIVVRRSATDPNGFIWQPVQQGSTAGGDGLRTAAITVGLIAAFCVGSAVLVRGRRRGDRVPGRSRG
jgi:hypothetical protein